MIFDKHAFTSITGLIDRRILINYQVDEAVVKNILPKPFSPLLVKGKGIVGICMIRLKHIRPKLFPKYLGISSENAAHRIAIQWDQSGETKTGVYIPRRDTSSRVNSLVGGKLFPGVHHFSDFSVNEDARVFKVGFKNNDGTSLRIEAEKTERWNAESVFDDLKHASDFFENGSYGYSPSSKQHFDGLWLKTKRWDVFPLDVHSVYSHAV